MHHSHRAGRRRPFAGATATTAIATVALLLAGCGSSNDPAGAADADGAGSRISVVATTNVYAAIASEIGGDAIAVSAILDNPSADPHSFEAAPKDQLKIVKAQLVIANGGGYDDFATTMVDAADPKPVLIDAVEASGLQAEDDHSDDHDADADTDHADTQGEHDEHGHHHDHGAFNEHVFYSPEAMTALGRAVATELGALDPANADTFADNADAFADELAALDRQAADIKADHPGLTAIVTEPVADYLLADAGITDVTPPGYTEAIESETDPAAKDLAEVDELIADGSIGLLVYNEQTSGPVTKQLRSSAEAAGIPVLAVSESLPEGTTDYPTWIGDTLDALDKALG